jgi:hypothetical protein
VTTNKRAVIPAKAMNEHAAAIWLISEFAWRTASFPTETPALTESPLSRG